LKRGNLNASLVPCIEHIWCLEVVSLTKGNNHIDLSYIDIFKIKLLSHLKQTSVRRAKFGIQELHAYWWKPFRRRHQNLVANDKTAQSLWIFKIRFAKLQNSVTEALAIMRVHQNLIFLDLCISQGLFFSVPLYPRIRVEGFWLSCYSFVVVVRLKIKLLVWVPEELCRDRVFFLACRL
jgi:hypothetical protein